MTDVTLLGSRPLARRILQALDDHDGIDVATVITCPADHDGWWDGSLFELAESIGYPVHTTEDAIFEYDIDYILSVLYFDILGPDVLEHPAECGVNLHQAELPRYRGSNSFSHTIMNARDDDYWQYGTTLHVMTEELDAGDVIDRNFVDITEDDTARSLYEKTEDASVEMLERQLDAFASKTVEDDAVPQEEFDGPGYFYASDSLEDGKEVAVEELTGDTSTATYDKIRALDFPPFKPAYTVVNGKEIYLTNTSYEDAGKYF